MDLEELKSFLDSGLSEDSAQFWGNFDDIEHDLPFVLARTMGIKCPVSCNADWVSEMAKDIVEKNPVMLRNFILIREQRAAIEGQLIFRNKVVDSGFANDEAASEMLRVSLLAEMADIEVTASAI